MIRLAALLFFLAAPSFAQWGGMAGNHSGGGGNLGGGGGGGTAPPASPVAGAFTNVTTTALTANWTAGSPAGTTYQCDISVNNFSTVLASSVTANLSATFSGLSAGTVYYARVDAINAGGTSAYTSLGSTTTTAVSNPIDPANAPSLVSTAPSFVWTVSDPFTKVFMDNAVPSSSQTFKLSGAVNSKVVGMLFIKAPVGGLSNVNVSMTKMTGKLTGVVLSTTTTSATGAFNISFSSGVIVATPTANASLGYMGASGHTVPDAQIPLVDDYFHQLTNLNMVNVAANYTQIWSVIGLVPQGTPSDFYTFDVFVTSGTGAGQYQIADIKGALEVFASTIPAVPTFPMANGAGYADICVQAWGANNTCATTVHSGCSGSDDCAMVFQHDAAVMMIDNRQSMSFNVGGWLASQMQTRMGMLMNGTTSSILINPMLVGGAITTWQPGGVSGYTNNTTATTQMTSLQNAQPSQWTKLRPINYACDEPPTIPWSTCLTSMNAIVASGMPSLITTTVTSALAQGATGLMATPVRLVNNIASDMTNANAFFLAKSSATLGIYADCVSSADNGGTGSCNGQNGGSAVGACAVAGSCGWPNPHIDGLAINNFSLWPVAHISSSTLNLNSTISQCMTTACGNTGSVGINSMWKTGGVLYDGQGDENWAWACTPALLGSGVTIPFYCPSLRINLMAYGEQYREYEKLLEDNGQGNYAAAQRYTWIKDEGAINENPYAPATYNSVSYSGNAVTAMQNLLCKLQSLTYPGASCAW